jgi:hypothetical protein
MSLVFEIEALDKSTKVKPGEEKWKQGYLDEFKKNRSKPLCLPLRKALGIALDNITQNPTERQQSWNKFWKVRTQLEKNRDKLVLRYYNHFEGGLKAKRQDIDKAAENLVFQMEKDDKRLVWAMNSFFKKDISKATLRSNRYPSLEALGFMERIRKELGVQSRLKLVKL